MRETDPILLQQRNAELEHLVAELRSQLAAQSVQDVTDGPKAVAPSSVSSFEQDAEQARSLQQQITKLEQTVEQLRSEISQCRCDQARFRTGKPSARSSVDVRHEAVLMLTANGPIAPCKGSAAKILPCAIGEFRDRTLLDLGRNAIQENGAAFHRANFPSLSTARDGMACSEVMLGLYKPEYPATWMPVNPQPLFQPEGLLPLMKGGRQAQRGKSTATFQFTRAEGDDRGLLVQTFSVGNLQRQAYHSGIAEDMTAVKQHEAERQAQEQRLLLLESVVLNAHDAIIITEAEPVEAPGPRIVFVNDAFTRMMGYDRQEVIGKTPRILQGPKTDSEVLSHLRSALKNWQPVIAELINYHKNGAEVWIELSIFPVADRTGKYTYWVGLQRDITHRKQAESEMRKALEKERELSELKSNFVGTVSHEFRTPLSTILSSADMLEFYAGQCAIEKQLEHIQRIQFAALNMKELLDDILILERAEARKLRFEPVEIELLSFCESLVEEMRLNDQQQHHLGFTPQTDRPEIRGYMDVKLMRQILTNLLSNALKYSPSGSTISFQLWHDQTQAYFEIQDQGIGIPAFDQVRLFEAFYRATNVGTVPGNGLGLAIVKQSVEIHQGQIHLTSDETQGTTVRVSLPLQSEAMER